MFLRRSLKLLECFSVLAAPIQLQAATQLQQSLDNPAFSFVSGSNTTPAAPWVAPAVPADALDDADCARSPALTKAGESWIEASVTGPDAVGFMWSLQTTAANTLTCTVDGTVKASCAPGAEGRWSYASVQVPEGSHTVRWNYKQIGTAGGKALLDCVGSSADYFPWLSESPFLQVVVGEPVSYRFTTRRPALYWNTFRDALPLGLEIEGESGVISGIPTEPGFWRPLIRVTNESFPLYYRIGFEVVDRATLRSALDSRGLAFTTTASDETSVWTPQARGSRDDGDCLVAGLPPPVKRTVPFTPGWSSVLTSVTGPDVLSYWVRVANGRVSLLLDGKEYRSHGPRQALPLWQRAWLAIPPGPHTVTWKYETNLQQGPSAWLDDIHLGSEGGVFIRHRPEIGPLPSGAFDYAVPFSGAGAWSAAGLPAGLTLNAESGVITGTLAGRGMWPVRLTLTGMTGDRDDVFALINAAIPAAEAVDLPNSWWDTGPEPAASWFGQDAVSHDGRNAMRSPPVPSGGSSALTTTLSGPGTLRWWWHIPAGSSGDTCSFAIDGGKPLVSLSGPAAWKQESVSVPSGLHEVSWRWIPDGTGDPGTEAVFIDEVSVVP